MKLAPRVITLTRWRAFLEQLADLPYGYAFCHTHPEWQRCPIQACKLIQDHQNPLEAAYGSGFQNLFHGYRTFRSYVHQTPATYLPTLQVQTQHGI